MTMAIKFSGAVGAASKWTDETAVIYTVLTLNLSISKGILGQKKRNHKQNVFIERHNFEYIVNCDVGLHEYAIFPSDKHIYSPSLFKCTV